MIQIMSIATKSVEIKPEEDSECKFDIRIKLEEVDDSKEQMEHLIDCLVGKYGITKVRAWINYIYGDKK